MMYNMLESVSIKGQMERILNLIANSHFMQGIYEKKNDRVRSLWCIGSALNQRMMQIQGNLIITE